LNSVTHPHCGNPVTPSRQKDDFLSLRGILEPINKHQNLQKKIIYGHTRISKRFREGNYMGTVTSHSDNGEYTIEYDDGDYETMSKEEVLPIVIPAQSSKMRSTKKIGSKVI